MTRPVHPAAAPALRLLLRDRRGLSTLEYTLLFVVILVGALALWHALGGAFQRQLGHGETQFEAMLGGALNGASAPTGTSSPGVGHAEDGAPARLGGPSPTQLTSTPPSAASDSPARPRAAAPPDSTSSNPASAAAVASAGSPQADVTTATGTSATSSPSGFLDRKLDSGGKVAVVAAGALAGAALAAGASVVTTYAATAVCGPAAPLCAGAVTGYFVYQGGKALYNGGWTALKGAFTRTFSSEQASVGDALTVGMTIGGAAYGVGEATGVVKLNAAAAAAGQATRAEVAQAIAGLARGRPPPTAPIPESVYHAVKNPQAAQGVVDGIDPRYFNPESRFGKGFYVAEKPETALAEMGHYNVRPTHGVRFQLDLSKARVLDLTDPAAAAKFGYVGGEKSALTRAIGTRALQEGYNAIRFPSVRDPTGNNIAVINDFNTILKPQIVTPIP